MKIYELNLACVLLAPGLAWQASLKKAIVELELQMEYEMDYDNKSRLECVMLYISLQFKSKQLHERLSPQQRSSYFIYWNVNNLYEWAMSQKLSVNNFKWRNNNLNLIKNYNENKEEGYILEVEVYYPKELQ